MHLLRYCLLSLFGSPLPQAVLTLFFMKIKPAKSLLGNIVLPGDKSIWHRAALLASRATGETRIENFATSADCASTLKCLQDLGVEIFRENSTVFIKGVGKTGFRKSEKPLDCGNSGTTVRLISGILAGQNFDSVLIGDESLSRRPMKRIIEPLAQMGARIESENGCAPLKIYGKNPLRAISYDLPVASAQVKSCVLLAGLNADGRTSVIEPTLTRDHTERMLRFLGVNVEVSNNRISVSGDSKLTAKDLQIPSDISSAAFFLVAAACLESSEIVIENVGLNPTRNAILEVLLNFGADIEIANEKEVSGEPVGDLRVKNLDNGTVRRSDGEIFAPSLSRTVASSNSVISGKIIANLIDEIPILAIFGTQIESGLEIRGAEELRVKESDRIAAVVENLRRMNAEVEEFADGFRVEKSNLKGARIDSFGDHRIAMAFAIAALFATGETEIIGAESAAVSFPEFFDKLKNVAK